MEGILLILIGLCIVIIAWLLSIQSEEKNNPQYIPSPKPVTEPRSFVPMEDRIVPTSASYTNKQKDMIGNHNAELVVPGVPEIVIPYDFWHWPYMPTDSNGPYWPSGEIEPDYIYPGGRNLVPIKGRMQDQ